MLPRYFVSNLAVICICSCVHSLVAEEWAWDNGSGIPYLAEVNEDGTAYQFKFLSTSGVNYYIQSSEDLNIWTDDVFYRGIGNTITHPLFPLPQNDGGSSTPVAPEDYVPLIHGSLRIQEIKPAGTTTGLLVTWVSLDDDQPKSYVLHGKDIEDNAPLLYSKNFDDYAFFIQFMGTITDLNNVPPSDTLGTNDSALIGKLVDALPGINAEILANTAAQAASPPPPPMTGGRKFYRIRQFYTDTDMDGLQDHIENQQGTNMWNWDTDGDGISDSQDQNPLVNDAVADPDGAGLPASLDTDLLARYDFETLQGSYPTQTFEDRSGNNRHAASSFMGIDSLGMVSKAGKTTVGYAEGDGTTFQGKTNYALSFWTCFDEDSIKDATTGAIQGLFGIYDYSTYVSPQNHVIKKYDLWGLRVERMADGTEQWKLGGHVYDNDTNNDGYSDNPVTSTEHQTMSFTQPSGSIDNGKWHHIVVVREHPYLRVYIDGILKKQEQKSVILLDHTAGITEFCFGRWMEYLPNTQFKGKFDRMRIYGRALNLTEVNQIYGQDVDNDGLFDRNEVNSLLWRDSNGDGIRTNAESFYSINPFRYDPASSDHDGDGLTSLEEQNTHGTDLTNPDSDKDLMPDGWEVSNGLNPLSNDANLDADSDGLINIDEFVYKSNPQLVNTDGGSGNDLTNDKQEVDQGSNPHDDSDDGNPIPADEQLTIKIGVGDKSGSESEDYVMNIFRFNPDTGAEEPFYTLRSGGHGQYEEETLSIFKKSDSYSFQIDWQSSNLQSSSDVNNPEGADYDYTFIVEPQNDDNGVLIDQYDPEIKRADPNDPIAGQQNDVDTFQQTVENKRVLRAAIEWVDKDSKQIDHANIALWEKAFNSHRSTNDDINEIIPDIAVKEGFVEKDDRRFYVRFKKGMENGALVKGSLKTFAKDADPETDTPVDKIVDFEFKVSADNKNLVSPAFILVVDTHDDDFIQVPDVDGTDDAADDQTIMAKLEGKIQVELTINGKTIKSVIDVCDKDPKEIRHIKLNLVSVKTTDGTGIFWTKPEIMKAVEDANRIWSQACIKFVDVNGGELTEDDIVEVAQPIGLNIDIDIEVSNLIDEEEILLLSSVRNVSTDDIDVVFASKATNRVNGKAYTGQYIAEISPHATASEPELHSIIGTILMETEGKDIFNTLAHEIGHIILDCKHLNLNPEPIQDEDGNYTITTYTAVDPYAIAALQRINMYEFPEDVNLMKAGNEEVEINQLMTRKRLLKEQVDAARTLTNLPYKP